MKTLLNDWQIRQISSSENFISICLSTAVREKKQLILYYLSTTVSLLFINYEHVMRPFMHGNGVQGK
jgi:hypothetical protein